MACGLPIITSHVRGVPEIINEGENDFLIEPCSNAQLAEKAFLILYNDTPSVTGCRGIIGSMYAVTAGKA